MQGAEFMMKIRREIISRIFTISTGLPRQLRYLVMTVVIAFCMTTPQALAKTQKSHHHAHHHSGVSHTHKTFHHAHRGHHQHHHHGHVVKKSPVVKTTKNVKVAGDEKPIEITPDQSKLFNMQNNEMLHQKLPTPVAFQIQNVQDSDSQPLDQLDDNHDEAMSQMPAQEEAPVLTTRERLVSLVHEAIERLHHTTYRMGGSYFDLSRGVYEEDCSGYVDQLLNRAEPDAYRALTQWTHSNKPNSFDYYDFFRKLPNASSWHFWQKIKDVARLKPGAILVFRYHGHSRYGSGGHVMVVMSEPVPVESQTDTFLVKVSDSANSGHSDDTRAMHTSGVGIGTLLLRVNPFTHEPNAYAWKLSGWLEHADVAMAEPVTPA